MIERSYRVLKGKRMNSGLMQLRSGLAIRCIAVGLLSTTILESSITKAAERTEIAASALEFGGNRAKSLERNGEVSKRSTASAFGPLGKILGADKAQPCCVFGLSLFFSRDMRPLH
jgi:hypothetical protein